MTALVDEVERRAIAEQLDVSMIVEAAAGTGKTTSLVRRMVNLVRHGKAGAGSIAAITFTIKAASQLRERFQEELEKACRLAAPGEERDRITAALDDLSRGFIGTTHAFCARLLRERPVEARLDPEFQELDESAAAALTATFWNEWWERELAENSEGIRAARGAGLETRLLREAFRPVVENPDVEMVAESTPRPELEAATESLLILLSEIGTDLPTDDHREKQDDFEVMVRKLFELRDATGLDTIAEQLEFLEEANHASRKPTQRNWPDKARAKDYGVRWRAAVLDRVRPVVTRWYEYVHGVAIRLLSEAAAEFSESRSRGGVLTFGDLLVRTRDMLRDHAEVRRSFQRRYTHLLVDEFQDTDPVQAEIVFYLTGEDCEERSWRALRPRPGSLFIVGDPKQSIYRFRRADIVTYGEVRDRIEASGGVILRLSTNFRSDPAICSMVNEVLGPRFSGETVETKMQAQYVALSPYRQHEEGCGVFRHDVTGVWKNDEVASADAAGVARWVAAAVAAGMTIEEEGVRRPLRYSDVLLLTWWRSRLDVYTAALDSASVPHEVTGSRAFFGNPDLALLLPILRVVVDADDSVSLVSWLRGPLCGVDDGALLDFVEAGGRFGGHSVIPDGTDVRISRAMQMLALAYDDARQLPPGAVIARLVDRLALIPWAAADDPAGTRAGNLLLALNIARSLSAEGESLAAIVLRLQRLLLEKADIEELDVDAGRADVVRVMNLHQAKGLEAPVVFLVEPNELRIPEVELHVDRSSEQSLGYLSLTRRWGKGKRPVGLPPRWLEHEAREQKFLLAERERLLYVAATRAKNLLIVSRLVKDSGKVEGMWSDLARDAPALGVPLAAVADATTQDNGAAGHFAAARIEIRARLDTARQASYSVLPVTRIAHTSHERLVKAEEGLGKGTSWGRVLHRLFEAMLRDPELEVPLHAANLLKDEERDPADLAEVITVVEAVRRSPLWTRMLAADEKHAEVPFALEVDAQTLGLEFTGPTLLHGAIDLVFREGSVWYIIDYKSDSTAGRLDELVRYYAAQVEHYARFWSRMTGAETRAGLFFVDGCEERWVAVERG